MGSITISESRLKIVLEVYKKGAITFEEAKSLLTVDDRPISQINPDWLKLQEWEKQHQFQGYVTGVDPYKIQYPVTSISEQFVQTETFNTGLAEKFNRMTHD